MSTKHILVTGSNGFVGKHLVTLLKQQGHRVTALATHADPSVESQVDNVVTCNLTDATSVANVDFNGVDAIVHLAALSSQGMSFDQPQKFIADNSAMVINVYERILAQKLEQNPRVVMVSSGAVYDSNQPMPLTESSALTHGSPYAISKILGEHLADYYKKRGIESVVVRPFNHTGPGQGPGFLLPDMVKQLSELGESGALKVGNIATRRDYTDVRDVVEAYIKLATAETLPHNLYNICSGVSRSGEEIIALIAKALYGNDATPKTEVDQSRIRPNDPAEIFGSNQLLKDDTGWTPQIPFDQTVADYVAWFKANPF
ncbi:MAG TPA: NAD-dependent epimerase/dehydratase family protein [Candidatus Saccharimonas sp.]|nr:NAD-dependent epimerase/dehydratase family protein [Candidatus Saccharimonas sp.]